MLNWKGLGQVCDRNLEVLDEKARERANKPAVSIGQQYVDQTIYAAVVYSSTQ